MVSSFLNLRSTAHHLAKNSRGKFCLVCAGTGEHTALEDTLAAGALCDELQSIQPAAKLEDSAIIARSAFLQARSNLADAIGQASNARRLLGLPELRDDVEFCLRLNSLDLVAASDANKIVRRLR